MDINSIAHCLSFIIPLYCVYQLGSLAGIFSERSGVANVAIEGNMIMGAVIYGIFYQVFNINVGWSELSSVMSAIIITVPLAGMYMLILSFVTNRYMGDHIIVGTGMNLLAPAVAFLMYSVYVGIGSDGLDPTSFYFAYDDLKIHFTNAKTYYITWVHIILVITTIAIVITSWFFLNKTRFGLRLKSSGENPYSLETAGVSVHKTRRNALFIAGMLSALAGIAFTTRTASFFFTVNGSGFLAIGILILGQYKVSGTVIGSIIFAVLIGFFDSLPLITQNDYLIDHQNLLKTIPFIIPIIGLMIFRKSFVPSAVGKNFKKDQR